ncbi:MAG: phospholipid carrier-dependent glycosyltransferase, partial [Chitinophagaceae bacterium]
MKKSDLPYLLVAFIVLCVVFLNRLDWIPIRIWDEARLANSALHMYEHGLSIVPHYEGAPDMWSTKPPLMIWLQALTMKITGANEIGVRLPAAISALCTGIMIYFLGRRAGYNRLQGLLTTLVFASTYAYTYNHAGRTGDYDALLVLLVVACCYALLRFSETRTAGNIYIAGAALTLAALTKGVAAVMVLPGLALLLLLRRSLLPLLKARATYISAGIFVLLVGAYYAGRESINPGYLKAVAENELGGRFLTILSNHDHPFGWYIDNFFAWRNTFWAPFIVPAFAVGFASASAEVRRATLFNACCALPYLLIVSLAKTKLEWYDLPLYPFFAVQTSLMLMQFWQGLKTGLALQRTAVSRNAIGVMLAAILFYYPFSQVFAYVYNFTERPWDAEPHAEGWFLQNAIRHKTKKLDEFTFCYADYSGQIQFYTRALNARSIPVQLQRDLTGLPVGRHLVVCQDSWRRAADSLGYRRVAEEFGCTEYI